MLFRCPECRTRRQDYKLFTKHLRDSGHRLCKCSGYHYSHRKGSPFCYENPVSDLYHASRRGEDFDTLRQIAEHILNTHPDQSEKVHDVCAALCIDLKDDDGNQVI